MTHLIGIVILLVIFLKSVHTSHEP